MLTIQMFDCTSFVVHFFTKSRSASGLCTRCVRRSASLNMTIMAGSVLFLIRKTLRPGPARAESATPAAGPGEHTKNEYC